MPSNEPVVSTAFVDKLTFLLTWATDCTKLEQKNRLQAVITRLKLAAEDGICKKAYIEHSRYLLKFFILLPSGAQALVQVGARDPIRQKGGISVTLNPSRLLPTDVHKFHEVMTYLIGSEYLFLIESPLLNRADFAVDIINVDMNDLLVMYNRNKWCTIFGKRFEKETHVESYYFGSMKSDFFTCIYDKNNERANKSLISLLEHCKKQGGSNESRVKRFIRERNGPEIVRVEVRAAKLRGCPPYALLSLPNRFEWFQFADLAHKQRGLKLSELDTQAFLALCRQHSVSAAFALYERERPDVPVREFWKSRRAGWWDPKTAWSDACEALRASGIFPECAFRKPEVPNLDGSPSK